MPVPTWSPGQDLSDSDVNNWLRPTTAVKTADTGRTSTTALVNDPDLVLAVSANATYRVLCYLNFDGGNLGASDLKVQWSVPSTATFRYQCEGAGTGGGYIGQVTRFGSDIYAIGTLGAGNPCAAMMTGSLKVLANAGSIQLLWAQNTSSGTATTMRAQSFIEMQRIA